MAPTKRAYTYTAEQQVMLKALAERKVVKVQRKKKVPVEEPVPEPEPEKEQKPKRIKHKYVQKEKNVYPYLGDRESLDDIGLSGVVKDVQKAARRVLDKNGIRCTVPLPQMAAAAKRVRETLENRRVERYDSSLPALDATIDEAFSEFSEKTCGMDKSIFRQELVKYQAIAATQLDKLETSTLLRMVMDLMNNRPNMIEYEAGGPEKPSQVVNKFFGLTKLQYRCLTDHQKLTLLKEHSKHRYKYYKEYEDHLNAKYRALLDLALEKTKGKKANQISKADLFKHWPEGRTIEEELAVAFERCRDMQRFIHMEFYRLSNKEEDCVLLYHDIWRHMRLKRYLKGKKGPLKEAEEHQIDREFANCPLDVLKGIADKYMEETDNDEEEEEKAKKKEEKENEEKEKAVDGEKKEDTVDGMEAEKDGNEKDKEEDMGMDMVDGMEMDKDGNEKDKEEDMGMDMVDGMEMEKDGNEKEMVLVDDKDVFWNGDEEEVIGMELEEDKEKDGMEEDEKAKEKEGVECDPDWIGKEVEVEMQLEKDDMNEGDEEEEPEWKRVEKVKIGIELEDEVVKEKEEEVIGIELEKEKGKEKEGDECDPDWNGVEEEVIGIELNEDKDKDKEGDKNEDGLEGEMGEMRLEDVKEKDKEGDKNEDGLEGEMGEMRLEDGNEKEKEENEKGNDGQKEGEKKKKKKRKDKLQLLVRQPKERSPPIYMAVTPAYHTRYDPL